MFDHARLIRVITAAIASCAVTCALAAGAIALPATDAPADTGTTPAPAFKDVPGDTGKAPDAGTASAYPPAIGDHLKTPDPAQVQRVLDTVRRDGRLPTSVPGGGDDRGALALALAIGAVLAAFGAVTVLVSRSQRPVLGA